MAEFFAFVYRQLFSTPQYPTTDCTGKTIVITGANVGLGKEAARHFVRLNAAKVILGCRSAERGEAAKRDIEATTKRAGVVEVWSIDLANYESVKAFAKKCESLKRIDAFLNNAGIAVNDFKLWGGFESTLTVNVVSTLLLTLLMIPKLQAVGREFNFTPTISITSSEVHGHVSLPEAKQPSVFKALNTEKGADMANRYPTSKLLEILALREIAREHPVSQLRVTINCFNPGLCESELARELGIGMAVIKFLLARTTEVGSRTLVNAALQGEATHGEYLSDCKITPVSGVAARKDALEVQKKVWTELSATLNEIQPGLTKVLD